MPPILTRRSLCLALLAVSACKSDRRAPDPSPRGVEPPAGEPAGAAAAATRCSATPLFPARSLGDGRNDLYRAIAVDDATHELLFSDLHTIYVAPTSGGEPRVVLARKEGVGHRLWLRADRLLMAGSDMIVNHNWAVLFALPRAAAATGPARDPDLEAILPLLPNGPDAFHSVEDVRVVGDTVYWLAKDGKVKPRDRTASLRAASWSHPGEPRVLYSTNKRASYGDLLTPGFVIAGGKLYVNEQSDAAGTEPQLVVDLETGARSAAPAALGGPVIGGNDDWVIVAHDGLHGEGMSTMRLRPDGSAPLKIADTSSPRVLAGRDLWAVIDLNLKDNTTNVMTVVPATGERKQLGCIPAGTTIHAVALGADAVYVSVFREQRATILRFAR